ncbi:hypothetical protein MPTK1_3g09980 [Marchantia polymorpha subsp. ruderalis]|uniref:Protein ENHANCED DISEASE RESISTANCE 2 C-terminal domain-containing protein n=2 Tax=Marchantia polymorpha TaxID=3197 RepID=A0A176WSA6_MARPO|nr:hypothetical protein AXG93_2189s1250 [Marchantia polymorpha subsp. ruderalis]PTQ33806.1 hypothetical protein MARPO_0085s0029 [Marchantia polymorpha]PTQ33808.1 hypothetical protein MARPO_0085s0029 [Marchantia polymorpha]BBN05065.1 hypothetical protein Mp_3g09980 [Marchantia polymorpha subsp. ruderalis]BBN05066.1 hypothetical protein Mp_3g09980 [Marchantia polymorpha subsp. ruderalis]|eukprot:PTQ33806.1 hypothetical protein MARPO_0085s0029 [Marchantia polymorpha]
MGGCVSTPGKSKRRRTRNAFAKARRGSRGSANFVIPVNQSSLDVANHKYEIGHNAKREFADGGPGNAFLLERPVQQVNANGHGHPYLDHQHSGAGNSHGSKEEKFFETDVSFNSDDEYMSVCGEFSNSAGNSLSYPSNNATAGHRPSIAELQVGMAQADKHFGVSSGKVISSTYHANDEGIPNGIAALTGTTPESFKVGSKSLDRSPRKSFQSTSAEEKSIANRGKFEKSVSDLPGRKVIISDTSSGRNSAPVAPSVTGGSPKASEYRGVFDNMCIPRLRTTMTQSRSRPISPRNFKKKSSLMRFSFKRHTSTEQHDDHEDDPDSSARYFIERPLAGSQVPRCSSDKPVDGCWSEVEPSVFKLRGKHYSKDKKKFAAPNYSLFVPIGVDLFMSSQKLDHIAQYVELPSQDVALGADTLPGVFIVNVQLPLYPPAIFMGDGNGDGLSLVLYFKLSEESVKQAPTFVKDMLRKFVTDEVEKVKAFVGESHHPFRDRLKVVARLVNPEEIHFSGAEKKLLVNYNEKPVLSRPQHFFYRGANYLEVDLDVHRFSYIARKGFDTFRERLKHCVLDIGLTLQATKQDELPEQVLAAVRLHKLDFGDYKVMQAGSTVASVKSEDVNGVPGSP